MYSFRNRLLALIIGLVIATQSVTLVAVLYSTAHEARVRADERLRYGSQVVQQYMRLRAGQLSSTVAVMAADFGFKDAVATHDGPTMLSAATNHAERIGWDVVVFLDTDGRLLASNSPYVAAHAPTVQKLINPDAGAQDEAHLVVLGDHLYQFFVTPVRAPETIAWVAMGFAVDDELASHVRDLVGTQVSVLAGDHGRLNLMASTLPPEERAALAARHDLSMLGDATQAEPLGQQDYLTSVSRLGGSSERVAVVLQQPMAEVMAPYRSQRNALAAIGGIALGAALGIALLLSRGATRPIRELVRAAQRIQAGTYDKTVDVGGGEEFRSLAATFNAMQENIAEREARISHDAHHDALTGLPNRTYTERHLEELLRLSPPPPVALILLEVVNLGEINASLGHHVGDSALREMAQRLRQNCGENDITARLGSAQFLVVARGCTLSRAALLTEQLIGSLRAGFSLLSVSLDLHVNAGMCCAPDHDNTAEGLLRHVHTALEDAGEARGRIAVYRPGREEELRRRLALAGDLGGGIERNELTLVYQPKIDLASGRVRSLEALARWTHAQLGPVSPGEFVPIAEQTGGSRRLTSWALGAAIAQMAAWRRDGIDIDVAVNLSAPDLLDSQLGDEILETLGKHGVPPTRLILEITEGAVIRDPALAVRNMQLLRIAGVRFSLDDFGTGYSSLSQLSRLPLDELKIDRSFITRAHERRDDVTIIMSTIELAHNMGLKVVAEGVETHEAWNLLQRLGCDLVQGYLVSRPLSVADTVAFLKQAQSSQPVDEITNRQLRTLKV
ncbi:MAG TPA: EAL domain-containing protein [Steroidobacteraceae bacterium]|jgi:diguanylate cyclase (GGDEF)-like protein|nr:EAL domain-containing protein [Steroidobacteraceae bacterium]